MLSEIDFKGDDVLAKGKYRFVCLHQSGSVVSFLQSFEEKITDEPVAGDASIMPIAVTAVLSAAGLYLVNKKDDEE